MNIPENWLKDFVNIKLSTEKLAHLLTMSGLEVESFAPVAPRFSGVVGGRDPCSGAPPERRQADGVHG